MVRQAGKTFAAGPGGRMLVVDVDSFSEGRGAKKPQTRPYLGDHPI